MNAGAGASPAELSLAVFAKPTGGRRSPGDSAAVTIDRFERNPYPGAQRPLRTARATQILR
jgi:hypothetical protein